MRPSEPGRIALSCAREKPHRNVGEKNQDARLEGKTVGSERALIEPRLLMRLVQDEEEHARADQREVEEHEERVGDALARVVADLRRGRGFGEDEPCGDDDDEREARDEVDGDVEAFRAEARASGGSERNA